MLHQNSLWYYKHLNFLLTMYNKPGESLIIPKNTELNGILLKQLIENFKLRKKQ